MSFQHCRFFQEHRGIVTREVKSELLAVRKIWESSGNFSFNFSGA